VKEARESFSQEVYKWRSLVESETNNFSAELASFYIVQYQLFTQIQENQTQISGIWNQEELLSILYSSVPVSKS